MDAHERQYAQAATNDDDAPEDDGDGIKIQVAREIDEILDRVEAQRLVAPPSR